ncbi:MAG: T9SS type A sorting domain-containing protein, partial [Chitinophagales bacterium]
MRKFTLGLFVLLSSILQAQIISYEKIDSFTISELEDILTDAGAPSGLIQMEYEVDYYRVIYLTPYRHPDSLVQASAGLAIPRNTDCPVPIASYAHGTTANQLKGASTKAGGQWEIGTIFASTGYAVAMPDYIGLGIADPKVVIHPYQHAFSQSNTSLNMIRATEEILNELEVGFNEQLFLYGYSQGGYAVAATQRLIEEEYPDEYTVTAAAPMSGAYDMAGAQVDLMASDSVYPTPGYLPYIILAYQDQYGTLYDSVSQILKPPYDSLMPALFYSKDYSIGYINNQSTPVPKHMVMDSTVTNFTNNPNHPLRVLLEENEMLNWTPQGSVKLYYCTGDDQVSYVNSERAYDSWTANGAPDVTKQDFGNLDHTACAQLCFISAKNFFDGKKTDCNTTDVSEIPLSGKFELFPNPASELVIVKTEQDYTGESGKIMIFDALGKVHFEKEMSSEKEQMLIDISNLAPGYYVVSWVREASRTNKQLVISK